jgi:copper chaperone CopZ
MPDQFVRLHVAGMTCSACVARVESALAQVAGADHVHVDLGQGTAMVSGGESLDQTSVESAVQAAGYEVASANGAAKELPATSTFQTFKPLMVALGLLVIGSLASGGLDGAMGRFMGGFFLVFSGLKMLDLQGFAKAYSNYDLLARRVPSYGLMYPFLEAALGCAYLAAPTSLGLHAFTLALMLFSSLGVIRSVLRAEELPCACMGSSIQLPMTTVTIVEDLGMAAMAGWMLVELSLTLNL